MKTKSTGHFSKREIDVMHLSRNGRIKAMSRYTEKDLVDIYELSPTQLRSLKQGATVKGIRRPYITD